MEAKEEERIVDEDLDWKVYKWKGFRERLLRWYPAKACILLDQQRKFAWWDLYSHLLRAAEPDLIFTFAF